MVVVVCEFFTPLACLCAISKCVRWALTVEFRDAEKAPGKSSIMLVERGRFVESESVLSQRFDLDGRIRPSPFFRGCGFPGSLATRGGL